MLRDGIGVRDVMVGKSFAFGKGRSGQVQDLIELGTEAGFNCPSILSRFALMIRLSVQPEFDDVFKMEGSKMRLRYLGRYYSLGGRGDSWRGHGEASSDGRPRIFPSRLKSGGPS